MSAVKASLREDPLAYPQAPSGYISDIDERRAGHDVDPNAGSASTSPVKTPGYVDKVPHERSTFPDVPLAIVPAHPSHRKRKRRRGDRATGVGPRSNVEC